MRLLISAILLSGTAGASVLPYFHVLGKDSGAWPQILSSIGLEAREAATSHVLVARTGEPVSAEMASRVENGAFLVLEGESPLAESFGFKPGKSTVRTSSLQDVHNPALPIVWEHAQELPVMDLPAGARVFTRERWTNAPMSAGLRRGAGAVLWIAASSGQRGYERFPYVLASLCDLGFQPPFRSNRLWAFFDSSYRLRVDLDYFAARWRRSGISALHVAAWHFYEPDAERDAYLRRLIEACHREGILVYAWLELPHVSEKFWADHPEWREKTAVLQDAQLDWRKLMNLTNRDCFHAVSTGVNQLIGRFDWDGVNLAELYFESLEGIGNPSRFTPMNDDVRAQFRQESGFDPLELFGARKDEPSRNAFLEFRIRLARKMQQDWMDDLETVRARKPDLDLVLTHVDDRFDPSMRNAIGADAAAVLPMLDTRSFTFLIEDPATVWNLGAQRYKTIADRYRPLTPHTEKLAVDLNIAERYQDVYPTKQQTGTELFELVHSAAASFHRVALYFENSLSGADLPLLPASGAAVSKVDAFGSGVAVTSPVPVGIPWKGDAKVDGNPWPALDGETVWLPAGIHKLEPGEVSGAVRLVRLNGDLKSAEVTPAGKLQFSYEAAARAIAIFSRSPRKVLIDGEEERPPAAGTQTILLPRGKHLVTIPAE